MFTVKLYFTFLFYRNYLLFYLFFLAWPVIVNSGVFLFSLKFRSQVLLSQKKNDEFLEASSPEMEIIKNKNPKARL